MADSSKSLKTDVDALCASPSQRTLTTAREAFHKTVVAWSEIETIRFGPITEANRLERILFWPDRKSIGLKQVQAALASEEPSATDAQSIAGKSVAMQGLGALEFILYGTGAEELQSGAKPYRCSFGAAIAGNLASIADEVSVAWSDPNGFASQWASPSVDNPLFRTDAEAVSELVDVFVQGLEMVRDVRLNGFLGKWPEQDKPRQAIYWRSQATVPSLKGNLDGLKKLFESSGLAKTLNAENAHFGQSIGIVLTNGVNTLLPLGAPAPADLLKVEASREKLDHFRLITSTLSELVGVRLTGALGLSAGFSSLDGD